MTNHHDTTSYIRQLPDRLRALAARLSALGYVFDRPDAVLPGPGPNIEEQIQRLETLVGTIPASLADFYRTVGSIDLSGSHPEWAGCDFPDPLIVEPIDAALDEAEQYVELTNPNEDYWASDSGVFRAPIAPDALHKANASGGMWYGVEIPNASADPVVLEEPHALPFTRYLELCLSYGGFPGLAAIRTHTWPLADLRLAASAA